MLGSASPDLGSATRLAPQSPGPCTQRQMLDGFELLLSHFFPIVCLAVHLKSSGKGEDDVSESALTLFRCWQVMFQWTMMVLCGKVFKSTPKGLDGDFMRQELKIFIFKSSKSHL